MKLVIRVFIASFLSLFSIHTNAQVEVVNAYPNLSFNAPIDYQFASQSDDQVYVAERSGRILTFKNDVTTSEMDVFLDIEGAVNTSGEGGLLGFDFHPDFESNGYVYVYYTAGNPFRSIVSRFEVPDDQNSVNEDSELMLMEIDQPYSNHNAGQIHFGPDNYLYIALGDGGSGGDPEENGQDRATLLGSLLRIDVDSTEDDLNYAIPDDNPYVNNDEGYREEIYAYGFRNPYRFSFDAETDELWVADVGQSTREEINVVEKGLNYGWNTMEGSLCFDPSEGCDTSGLVLPVYEYGRDLGGSITGGFVYRGTKAPELEERYVYADFASGYIWSLAWDGDEASDNQVLAQFSGNQLIMFGEDQDRNLYLGSFDGNIYTFRSIATSSEQKEEVPSTFQLQQNYPNPFNPSTQITYQLPEAADIELSVFNMLGQKIRVLESTRKAAGSYTISFDASSLTSGVYIYQLQSGSTTLTRKMTLIK
ncbi:MAG: glucose sorbosone dehydrogenase [Balneola sp.]|nr:glucose sorbosone dehydrogenase [Balneola sp.]|tara:strand:+ start:131162 stop:132595 length:1434 start_codon:yes stop_codon:yes gene_type:complete